MATNTVVINVVVIVIVCVVVVFCPGSVTSDDMVPIPQQKSEVEGWFKANVQPLPGRKGLDPALTAAEAAPVHIAVGKGGKFKTIQEAVNSIPHKNTKRHIINIAGGIYKERVKIEPDKHFVTFYGDPKDRPTIDAAATAAQVGTIYSATLYVLSDYFMAVNINVKNSAPRPSGKPDQQAVALTISGNKAAFYNCKFYGFQDTVCDNIKKHFYKDCYIEGTVDFFFGDAKSIILNTELHVFPGDTMAMVTAHGRKSAIEDTGLSFVQCRITGSADPKAKVAVLGRAWFPFAKVVFIYSDICGAIRPEGWFGMNNSLTDGASTYFGEYKNTGPGSGMAKRPKFVKKLTDAEAHPFITLAFIEASKWLLPPITKAVQANSTKFRSRLN
ncbi:PREDICTED: pectinesterase 1-like [Ipomoea nil]|uniref:pectinesterase 1-like n=1 Tax=Ipomoea nil TaxID=35883 RepID=UPI00090139B2|nr:PREDICTED: pectinesterase 1-like [Ipomoea nil]